MVGTIGQTLGFESSALVFPQTAKSEESGQTASVSIDKDGNVIVSQSPSVKWEDLPESCRKNTTVKEKYDALITAYNALPKTPPKSEEGSTTKPAISSQYLTLVEADLELAKAIAEYCGCVDEPYVKSLGTTTVRVSWYKNGSTDITIPIATEALITRESVEKGGGAFTTGPRSPAWWKPMRDQYPPTTPDDKWERGHLIGKQLGGPGASTWWNMVPMHDQANDPGMLNCEKKIRKAAEEGHCVRLTVTPHYGNRKVIPLRIKIEAVSLNSNWKLGPVNIPNQTSVTSPCS